MTLVKYTIRLAVGLAVLWALFTLAMRAKCRPVQDAVRRMNRAVINPRQLRTAGQPGAYASIVRHAGRTSGTPYETPVQATPAGEGFVISLPYGISPDWLKNVLAAGSATIVHDGGAYPVGHPEIVGEPDAAPYLPSRALRTNRFYGIDQYLRVHSAGDER